MSVNSFAELKAYQKYAFGYFLMKFKVCGAGSLPVRLSNPEDYIYVLGELQLVFLAVTS
jgi:hypothetical protein